MESAELRDYMNSGVRNGPEAAAPRRSMRCHWLPGSRPPAWRSASPEGADGRPNQGRSGPDSEPGTPSAQALCGGRTDGSDAPSRRCPEARSARCGGEIRALEAVKIGGPSGAVSTGTIDPAAGSGRPPAHPVDRTSGHGSGLPDGPSRRAPLNGRAGAFIHAEVVYRRPS
jgi:hypothetical protein